MFSMRNTPQTTAIYDALSRLHHATNIELLTAVQSQFPDISATTVHRITKRLVQEGRIGELRSPLDGTMLFDANPNPHYHFGCRPCGAVQDISLTPELISGLKEAIGKPIIAGSLDIVGVSATCPKLSPQLL